MFTISLPLSVPVTKKSKFSLNLNQYRNAHYYTLNTAKTKFQDIAKEAIISLPKMDKISLVYTLFPPTKRDLDVANICSIVDKFFSDAMVANGKLEDDNYHFLPEVSYRFGNIDKLNPRVEVQIRSLEPTYSLDGVPHANHPEPGRDSGSP